MNDVGPMCEGERKEGRNWEQIKLDLEFGKSLQINNPSKYYLAIYFIIPCCYFFCYFSNNFNLQIKIIVCWFFMNIDEFVGFGFEFSRRCFQIARI